MMPPPITTTVALRGIVNISSPERQHEAGSASAAVTGSSPFGSGCTQSSGSAARSAKPPTRVALAHWLMRPCLQCRHAPQPKLGSQATARPMSRRLTPRPTSRTTPEYSWPMIMGGVHGKRPWVACTSVPQMPAAATSTTTCPGPATGSGASSRVKRLPPRQVATFTGARRRRASRTAASPRWRGAPSSGATARAGPSRARPSGACRRDRSPRAGPRAARARGEGCPR